MECLARAIAATLSPSVAACSSGFTMGDYLKETGQEHRVSRCALSTTWTPLPLLKKTYHTPSSAILEFGLPYGHATLNLPTAGCVMARAKRKEAVARETIAWPLDADETDEALLELQAAVTAEERRAAAAAAAADDGYAARPYTPISREDLPGRFSLLVKRYDAWGQARTFKPAGVVSTALHDLEPGDCVEFCHVAQNVKMPYPFRGATVLNLVCVGSGVAPMIQVLEKVLHAPGDDTRCILVYGCRSEAEIMMKPRLDELCARHRRRLKVVYCVGSRYDVDKARPGAVRSGWNIFGRAPIREKGWASRAVLEKHLAPPEEGHLTMVCGVPRVYENLCGARSAREVTGVLGALGWTRRNLVKL